jgi:AcrR family transcriptional regulator
MAKKNGRNTKQKIVSAAWKLFYEQGYEDTTVDDIVFESGTSKGSFYHYFEGKDALLGSLNILFDDKYEELEKTMDPEMPAIDKLIYLNHVLYEMIDSSVSVELLTRLFSSQLITHGEKHLLDRKRAYFKVLKQIVKEGQAKGEVRDDIAANQIVNDYAMFERALLYDWCLEDGEYSLIRNADRLMPMFLNGYRVSK